MPVPCGQNAVPGPVRRNPKRPRELRRVRNSLRLGFFVQRRAMRVPARAQRLPRRVRRYSPGPDELRHVRNRVLRACDVHGKRVHRAVNTL
jgi:hypothetical protein